MAEGRGWFWCTRHERVERERTCPDRYLLGPYDSAAAARNWRQRRDQREERWEAQDRAWKRN